MFNTIWKIRREGNDYLISLDPSSFNYNLYPKQDRKWINDNLEELMHEAKVVTQIKNLAFDHYGKVEEYGKIFFDIDEKVIQEVRREGEKRIKNFIRGLGWLVFIVLFIVLFIILLFCIS